MSPIELFALQFVLSLLAWGALGRWFVAPLLRRRSLHAALSVLLVPQMFRHIGVSLLAPGVVASEMPRSFAVSVAVGDTITAVLALVSFVALHRQWRYSIGLVWLTNVVGLGDLLHVFTQAVRFQPAQYFHAAWVVPTFLVPLMLVSHVMMLATLIGRRAPAAME